MSKYSRLWEYIQKNGSQNFKLTFEEIQTIAGIPIDHSFLKYKKELLEYGYQVGKISIKEQIVVFHQISMSIGFGTKQDIENWMCLVSKVSSSFPGLENEEALEEHKRTVLEFMHRQEAVCAKTDKRIIGVLLFSRERNELCFLAVDPASRRRHIGEAMIQFMLALMNPNKDITVTTYRDGVPEGIAARAFYQKLGFQPGRLTEEFGSVVQEFVLKRCAR